MHENIPQEPQPPYGLPLQGYQPAQQQPYQGFYTPQPQFGQQQGWEQQPRRGRPPGPPRGRGRRSGGHRVRNVVLGLLGVIVLIIIIAAVATSRGGSGVQKENSAPPGAAANSAPATQSPAARQNSTTGPVGTTFVVTDTNSNGDTVKYSVTLNQIIQNAQPDNDLDTAPSGDHLAGAEFTIKGLTGDDQDDANNCAAAIGANQQTYRSGFEGLAAGTNFDSGQFNTSPGSSSIGWVAFEVPDGVQVASIQWSPASGMSGSAPATWTVSG